MELQKNNPFLRPDYIPEPQHGTTTIALTFKDGVVVATDNRASAGYMVASPRAKKLHQLNDKTVMTIAGLVSDAQYLVKLLRAEIQIYELERDREMETSLVGSLLARIMYGQFRTGFPYYVGLILAGYDQKGPHVFNLDGSGAFGEEPFTSTGSGSPFAYGTLEAMYEENMDEEQAKKVGLLALRSAIIKDIATGDGMDCVVITKDGVKTLSKEDIKGILGDKYPFPK
ncbi:MAG: proteasome subunit beta [Candidatus Heimdallarchaeota archaeon]|nr:proteasome subunit beta [Candidatus Heimdallarchaeota archaeon]